MKKFIPKTSQGDFLRFNGHYLYVSKIAMDGMVEQPSRNRGKVDLYFDEKEKAIRLVFNDKGLLLMRKNRQISVTGLEMPKGRYFWEEKDIYKFQGR